MLVRCLPMRSTSNGTAPLALMSDRFQLTFALALAILLIPSSLLRAQSGKVQNGQNQNRMGSQANQPRNVSPQLSQAQRDAIKVAQEKAYAEHLRQREEAARRAVQQPEGFPLPADHAKYVGELLDHWQKVSEQVKAYKCNFQRFDYDNGLVNYRDPRTNQLAASHVAYGEIRYAAKDKASFETTRVIKFKNPPQKPGHDADYEAVEGHRLYGKMIYERWICDGKSTFDFDFEGKRVYQTVIPPQLQGNVVQSPLPFLFGANKADMMSRFWIRYIPKYRTDANGQQQLVEDEYWLEAYPKTINDARMYKKLEIVLAAKDFMPVAIHMYLPQYDGMKNFSSRYFLFQDRSVNNQLDKISDFFQVFVAPKTPLGWQRVNRSMGYATTASNPNEASASRK